jgi:aminoglycoside phosphotransferase (APT) family kinase protein
VLSRPGAQQAQRTVAAAKDSVAPQLTMTASSLDIEQPSQLEKYLRASGRVAPDETVRIWRLPGGVSNRTVMVSFDDGRSWVIKQALEKLRVAAEWYSNPSRIANEAQGLRRLLELAPAGTTTSLVFEDRQLHVLGMQAVPEPHENWKARLLAGHLEVKFVEQFGRILATIHRRAAERREELAEEFADRSIFESLRLEPYYAYTARRLPDLASFLHALIDETRRRTDTLVHGDYSPKNVLVHDGRLILIDHEVIHWGDPAFDVGFSLTHLLSKANHLPALRQSFATAARNYWTSYRQTLGGVDWADDFESRVVRHTLGCLAARVLGRSPLEYLDEHNRTRQTAVTLELMRDSPPSVDDLVATFTEQISHHESH